MNTFLLLIEESIKLWETAEASERSAIAISSPGLKSQIQPDETEFFRMQSFMSTICELSTARNRQIIDGIPGSNICKRFETKRNRSSWNSIVTWLLFIQVHPWGLIKKQQYCIQHTFLWWKLPIVSILLLSTLLLADYHQMIVQKIQIDRLNSFQIKIPCLNQLRL